MTRKRGRIALALLLPSCLLMAGRAGAADLSKLDTIYLPEKPAAMESSMAKFLQAQLTRICGRPWKTVAGVPPEGEGGLLLGRELAVATGMLTTEQADALKYDGYAIRVAGNRVALAGYDQVGVAYAGPALLRLMGYRFYPWRMGWLDRWIEVPPENVKTDLPAGTIIEKPYFAYRDLRTVYSPPMFGTTIRHLRVGDPKNAMNLELFGNRRKEGYTPYSIEGSDYVDWWHTAAFLVPRDLYYKDHPEYFAEHDGKRLPPSTYMRMQICMSNPDVIEISRKRLLEWMALQNDRRFFCVNAADTALCDCADCRKADMIPDYGTDRILAWVNAVAEPAAKQDPDKIIFTGAYVDFVKPPIHKELDPNVRVLYCPWFWTSRTTSSAAFDHPLNVTAMRELMGWITDFPGQIGVFDYPGSAAVGTARRVKMYARHGMRWAYFNGGVGMRLVWLVSRMLWDPFQDIEPLDAEFIGAYYGPAAEPIGELLRMEQDALDRYLPRTQSVLAPDRSTFGRVISGNAAVSKDYYRRARALLGQAERLAEKAEPAARLRILGFVEDATVPWLEASHPRIGSPDLRSDVETYRADFLRYVERSKQMVDLCEQLDFAWIGRQTRKHLLRSLMRLGMTPYGRLPGDPAEEDAVYRKALGQAKEMLAKSLEMPVRIDVADSRSSMLRFDGSDEVGAWSSDATQEKLIKPVEAVTMKTPDGEQFRGVRISAALAELPVVRRNSIKMHAGRFYAERRFEKPFRVPDGALYVDLHLWASRDVPVTIYLDGVCADRQLHAGEQIVRIDLQNYTADGFDLHTWDKIDKIAIDIWPQDNIYPYPPARDTEVTLFSLEASNTRPSPQRLPHKGKAIWLSQFRSNLPLGMNVPPDLLKRTGQAGGIERETHKGDPTRSFTEDCAVSPIYAIATAGAGHDEQAAAQALQRELEKVFGVRPAWVDPPWLKVTPETGNVILVGRKACRQADRVNEKELAYVGPGGFAINAWQGRIALAGTDAEGDAGAVLRYLEDQGAKLFSPGFVRTPDLRGELLRELYTLDPPWFSPRPDWDRWWLSGTEGIAPKEPPDAKLALSLAGEIKDLARAGKHTVPDELLERAAGNVLSRVVVSRLMRDPFTDATRLVREFMEAGSRAKQEREQSP